MKLVIIKPQESTTFDGVNKVTIPGSEGSFTILGGHAPLVSAVKKGVIRFDQQEIAIGGGVLDVKNDVVTILTDQSV